MSSQRFVTVDVIANSSMELRMNASWIPITGGDFSRGDFDGCSPLRFALHRGILRVFTLTLACRRTVPHCSGPLFPKVSQLFQSASLSWTTIFSFSVDVVSTLKFKAAVYATGAHFVRWTKATSSVDSATSGDNVRTLSAQTKDEILNFAGMGWCDSYAVAAAHGALAG